MVKNIALTVGLLVAVASPAPAQSKPDFSGTWVVEQVERSERPADVGADAGARGSGRSRGAAGGGRRGGQRQQGQASDRAAAMPRPQQGQRIQITQTADRLIVTSRTQGDDQTLSYALDGSETTNSVGSISMKSRTKWEGVALVTETSQPASGQDTETRSIRDVRSINQDGKMVVHAAVSGPRGAMTTTVTYTRAQAE